VKFFKLLFILIINSNGICLPNRQRQQERWRTFPAKSSAKLKLKHDLVVPEEMPSVQDS